MVIECGFIEKGENEMNNISFSIEVEEIKDIVIFGH